MSSLNSSETNVDLNDNPSPPDLNINIANPWTWDYPNIPPPMTLHGFHEQLHRNTCVSIVDSVRQSSHGLNVSANPNYAWPPIINSIPSISSSSSSNMNLRMGMAPHRNTLQVPEIGQSSNEDCVSAPVSTALTLETCNKSRKRKSDETEDDGACHCGISTNFDCRICLETSVEPVVTPCGHLFCWRCLYKWISTLPIDDQSCPVCKANVTENNLTPIYGVGTVPGKGAEEIPPRPSGQRAAHRIIGRHMGMPFQLPSQMRLRQRRFGS